MKRALFIGRWQPFHLGHEWLIRNKLDQNIPVMIAIRDIPPDEFNPYTVGETQAMIQRAFKGDDVKIIVIPDIESVNWGRGVGYEVNEFKPPEDIKRISATEIRRQIDEGETGWRDYMSPSVADLLFHYHKG
jgi:cytidyltransferase-like protein